MKKLIKIGCMTLLMGLFIAGTGFGADQKRSGDRIQDRKKDGSCQSGITGEKPAIDMSANQTKQQKRSGDRIQDQKKDASCLG